MASVLSSEISPAATFIICLSAPLLPTLTTPVGSEPAKEPYVNTSPLDNFISALSTFIASRSSELAPKITLFS